MKIHLRSANSQFVDGLEENPRPHPGPYPLGIPPVAVPHPVEFPPHMELPHMAEMAIVDGLEEKQIRKKRMNPKEPIIGLEYISEYQYVDATHKLTKEIRFFCHLCDVKSPIILQ